MTDDAMRLQCMEQMARTAKVVEKEAAAAIADLTAISGAGVKLLDDQRRLALLLSTVTALCSAVECIVGDVMSIRATLGMKPAEAPKAGGN